MTDIVHELPTGWRRTWRGSVHREAHGLLARVFTPSAHRTEPFRLMLVAKKTGRTQYSDHRTLEDAIAVANEVMEEVKA